MLVGRGPVNRRVRAERIDVILVDEASDVLQIDLQFMLKNGVKLADWERFEVFIHHSGTVAAEVGQLTSYTFRQQLAGCVRFESILEILEPLTSESDLQFGAFCIRLKGQTEFHGVAMKRTDSIVEFVESVVTRLDHRFHDQCNRILASMSNSG
jgi:hypothetical protein